MRCWCGTSGLIYRRHSQRRLPLRAPDRRARSHTDHSICALSPIAGSMAPSNASVSWPACFREHRSRPDSAERHSSINVGQRSRGPVTGRRWRSMHSPTRGAALATSTYVFGECRSHLRHRRLAERRAGRSRPARAPSRSVMADAPFRGRRNEQPVEPRKKGSSTGWRIVDEPLYLRFIVGLARIELATSSLSGMRSNRLSYSPGQRAPGGAPEFWQPSRLSAAQPPRARRTRASAPWAAAVSWEVGCRPACRCGGEAAHR